MAPGPSTARREHRRRTSVNRVLKRLEADGLVRVGYGQVELLDEDGLLKVAGL